MKINKVELNFLIHEKQKKPRRNTKQKNPWYAFAVKNHQPKSFKK